MPTLTFQCLFCAFDCMLHLFSHFVLVLLKSLPVLFCRPSFHFLSLSFLDLFLPLCIKKSVYFLHFSEDLFLVFFVPLLVCSNCVFHSFVLLPSFSRLHFAFYFKKK